MSEDPSGFSGGDPNLYRFAGNDPINSSDPTGLSQAGYPLSTLAGTLPNTALGAGPYGGSFGAATYAAATGVTPALSTGSPVASREVPPRDASHAFTGPTRFDPLRPYAGVKTADLIARQRDLAMEQFLNAGETAANPLLPNAGMRTLSDVSAELALRDPNTIAPRPQEAGPSMRPLSQEEYELRQLRYLSGRAMLTNEQEIELNGLSYKYSNWVDRANTALAAVGGFLAVPAGQRGPAVFAAPARRPGGAPGRSLIEQPRNPLGQFAPKIGGEAAPGSVAESVAWEAIANKPGWKVTPGRVYVRDASGRVRVYDGVATSPSNRSVGLEVKSGNGRLTPEQRSFDAWLNSSRANTAIGIGQNIGLEVQRAIQVRQ